jgi:CBS domain-containing protein
MRVESVMSRDVVSCTVCDRLGAVAQRMRESDVGSVVILDERGGLAGLVTDRDVALTAQRQGRPVDEIPVREAMGGEVWSCRPHEGTRRALERMTEHHVRRLPVVEDGKVVGLLSLDDLARAATHRRAGFRPRTLARAFAETTSARAEPSRPGGSRRAGGVRGLVQRALGRARVWVAPRAESGDEDQASAPNN